MLPIPTHAPPGERPLEPPEFALITKYIPNLKVHYCNSGVRIVNWFFRGRYYEDLSTFARAVYDAIARVDAFCLNRLGFAGLASSAVMYGPVRPPLTQRP